jgi:hypothetical protein
VPRWGLCAIAVVGTLALLAPGARADERRARPPVRLELGDCIDRERDAVQRAVRIELGDDAQAADDARSVLVRVDCAADGIESGVVIEVRPPGNPRRYRYALDWRAQPPDARPRLLGLAVAEAVDASRIELTAVPERAPPGPFASPGAAPAPVASSRWTVSVLCGERSFATDGGLGLVGLGLMTGYRLSRHLRLAVDATAETATVIARSGLIRASSLSAAPRLAYRLELAGGLHAEIGASARIGVARMVGESIPGAQLDGGRLVRAWLGPAATAAVGLDLTSSLSLDASAELGAVLSRVTARDLGQPAAVIGGRWTALHVVATIAL